MHLQTGNGVACVDGRGSFTHYIELRTWNMELGTDGLPNATGGRVYGYMALFIVLLLLVLDYGPN